MALQSSKIDTVGNESLDEWRPVGSGGYGRVYKARHKGWGFDVAIKILHVDDRIFMTTEKVLWEEVKHMEKASCEFVVRVYGIYQGCPTVEETHMRQGIIMEFMGRGSVEFLLKELCGPPPWPLAFRLAHQVALGMNFLHSRNLMHHDLKPSNILLTDELHVKLADFGLSRVATSALSSIRETTQATGGSWKYMPPEAFEASYEPVRAFDRYSYGILLWSILTGKEPYPVADYNLVALRIPKGDRPPFDDINVKEAEGLKELVDLMKRCWEKTASNRPTFTKCLAVTENVFSKHKTGIRDAVHNVLKKLDLPAIHQDEKTSVEFNLPLQTPDEPALKGLENLKRFPEAQRSSEQVW
ncbi:ankyrin repeat and protein kinase domain-containing protein 1-like [Antennarius striatus]|uniref:ankyrin repeat and protein kinase domain-containing protein 1-like n=1 Tax=Antennarius striatus TaxID=241820 RepID=UPI0035B1CB36